MKTLEETFEEIRKQYKENNQLICEETNKLQVEDSDNKRLLLSNFNSFKSRVTYRSSYSFLNNVNALTQSNFNLIVGRTGKGKTDLMVSLAFHNITKGLNVAIFISEGEVEDFYKQLNTLIKSKKHLLNKIAIFDEKKAELNYIDDPIKWNNKLLNILKKYNIQAFYFDNLSTLRFTNSSPEIETRFIKDLVDKTRSHNICFTALIHTTKTYHPLYEISLEGIRGNASHVNLATNIFAFNNYEVLDKSLRTIKILKSRNFGEKVGETYKIFYKKQNFRGFYQKDIKISENESRRYFAQNNRQKLSGLN